MSRAIHYTIGIYMEPTAGFAPASAGLQNRRLSISSHVGEHEREDLNPVRQFWRLAALPGAHSCKAPGLSTGNHSQSLLQFHVPIHFADELRPTFESYVVVGIDRLPCRPDRLAPK